VISAATRFVAVPRFRWTAALAALLAAVAISSSHAEATSRFTVTPPAAPAGTTFEVSFRAPEAETGSDCCLESDYELTASGPCLTLDSELLDGSGDVSANGRRPEFDDNPISQGDLVVIRFRPGCAGVYRGLVEYVNTFDPFEDGREERERVGDFAFRATGPDALASTGAYPRLIAVAGAALLLGGGGLRRFATSRSACIR
jgi:hypothetical protein